MDQELPQEIKNLNERFDTLSTFILDHVATKRDLQDLRKKLPSKDDFSKLQTSVDGVAKSGKDNTDEIKVLGHQISRMEEWIKRAAPKLGVEYKP
jgi:predicted  nucleic acid-binding Zn-ribbon protein